jgi:hypothetical protein
MYQRFSACKVADIAFGQMALLSSSRPRMSMTVILADIVKLLERSGGPADVVLELFSERFFERRNRRSYLVVSFQANRVRGADVCNLDGHHQYVVRAVVMAHVVRVIEMVVVPVVFQDVCHFV